MSPIRISLVALVTNLFLLLATVSEVSGLKCAQCTGSNIHNRPCFYGQVEATECADVNDTFCVSYSGSVAGSESLTVIRNCSSNNMSTECQAYSLARFGSKDHLQVCFFSCSTDGCNNIVYSNDAFKTRCSIKCSALISTILLILFFLNRNEANTIVDVFL